MRSFDLFHTLAASRTGMNAGEALVEDHIPIAENIAKVQPEDIIISDYHTPSKARQILQDVCGLSNPLICTEDGKFTGKVWEGLKLEGHLGDNPHADIATPKAHGIPAEYTTAWQPTDQEKQFGDLGWIMREARLRTWNPDPKLRALQLHQIERNFPLLYLVAQKLDAKMREGYTRLLLCSRDCYLLHLLMKRLFGGSYDIEYFYTSRLTRYRPSETYAAYAKERLSDKTLVVDMNGSGKSLKYMTDMFGGTPMLVCGIGAVVPVLVSNGIRETSNLAMHPMVADVVDGRPVYANPTNQDWRKSEILVMHEAFKECLVATRGFITPQYTLDQALRGMVNDPALKPLWADHLADSKAAYDLLNSGPLPHEVIL
jgi:hypothetical protein